MAPTMLPGTSITVVLTTVAITVGVTVDMTAIMAAAATAAAMITADADSPEPSTSMTRSCARTGHLSAGSTRSAPGCLSQIADARRNLPRQACGHLT
jgi:hypothetical protein